MDLDDALSQIREIRGTLARSTVYRGTRAGSVAATALVAEIAALFQPRVVPEPVLTPNVWTLYWIGAAVAASAIVTGQVLFTYATSPSQDRAATRAALSVFLPPLLAGGLLTPVLCQRGLHPLLPGVWATFVGLALLATRSLLPRASGIVGAGFVVAGAAILLALPGSGALEPWVMGLTFGLGPLAAAAVLYWNLERPSPADAREDGRR